jgi:signal transduction histidine kinase
MVDCKLTGDKIAKGDYELYRKEVPKELHDLSSFLGESGVERERFERLSRLTNEMLSLLEKGATAEANTPVEKLIENLKLQQIWSLWKDLVHERQELLNEYKERHVLRSEDLPTAQLKSSEHVTAMVVATVCMAFVLFLGFSKGVTQRLSVLSENAARLSRRQQLNPPVSGDDEISDLDRVFHQTAEALVVAERQKQEFVDMISHDLKTPLAALQGLLALVSAGTYGGLSQAGKERVTHAEQDLVRLIRLINELLDVEKMSAGALELSPAPVKLATIISEAMASVGTLAEGSDIKLVAESTEEEVAVDPERLVQVVVNLLSNAIRYSNPGGSVVIATEMKADRVRVSVRDQGCGIPAKDQEFIFDRFQQVRRSRDERREGTGLGLAICKAIVDAHGGRIGVDSREGEGSTFWFELPA